MAYVEIDPAITLHSAVLGPANGTVLDLTGLDGALIHLTTGGTAGVITPEVTTDGVEWRPAGALFQDMAGATVVTTPAGTTQTLYKIVGVEGQLQFRARISTAYVTTGITVRAYKIRA